MLKKLTVASLIVTVIAAGAYYVNILGSEIALSELHPDLDFNLLVKAHRTMLRRTLAGHYKTIDMTDDNCNKIFLEIVQELSV